MVVDKLYKLTVQDYRGNTDPTAILLLKGITSDVGVLGRQALPASQADMINLLNGDAIAADGAYTFDLLPRYICFTGAVDSIELVGYSIEEIGDIS